jgi:regulator of sigma E protease
MHFLTSAWVFAAVVLLFGAAIFVHEFGHFWMARRLGLKVEGFSIGFGPKIFGWRRDGIDYAWRWIPAGGFVKLPQMVTSEALEGKNEAARNLPPLSPWSRILVALAGPVMNGVFAFAIAIAIYFLGLPVRVNPAVIGAVEPGSPEAKLGLQPGDRIVAVNGKLVTSWEDAQMGAVMALTNVLPVTVERDGIRTTYNLTAKFNEQLGLKLFDLEPIEHPVIRQVLAGSAAEQAGLKPGDEVLSFAGAPVVGASNLIGVIRQRAGQPSQIEVKRGRQRLTLLTTPKLDPSTRTGRLGMEIGSNLASDYQLQKPGPLPWKMVGEICQQTYDVIAALVHSKQSGVGVKDLSGPPGILAALAGELKADFRLGLKFMVLLNINLAIINLLPLPVLDGGHILMAVVEKLRGRPVGARLQEQATAVFAILLISFMLYVSYNDLKRWSFFRLLWNQQVQIEPGKK